MPPVKPEVSHRPELGCTDTDRLHTSIQVGFVAALRPRNSPSSSAHAAKATFPMPANPHTMRKSRWIASSAPPRAGEAEDVFMTRPG